MNQNYAIAIHGGAGTIRQKRMTDEKQAIFETALRNALSAGHTILKKGGSACDAVEQAVVALEDAECFNAGKGSVLSHEGLVEMEASIMTGHDLKAGAVVGIQHIRNPVSLARQVMQDSGYVMVSGSEAEAFAKEKGLATESAEYFRTELRYNQWQKAIKRDETLLDHSEAGDGEDKKFGTVGAVALDGEGNVAAATSTGGLTNKKYGRLGDSSIIGAGTYANNRTCAISCTGYGEYFIRSVAAYDVSCLMEYKGLTLQEACDMVVHDKLIKIGGEGGLIALDREGVPVLCFNSEGMYRAWQVGDQKPGVAIFK
ncbi:MAG: isoaspartyl peptidase/L-asparaginase [Cyclobacteriaceae bacterium]